jgi:hypothetical protein
MGLPSIRHLGANAQIDFGMPNQRTEKGVAYERFIRNVKADLQDPSDEDAQKALEEENEKILRLKLHPGKQKDLAIGNVQQSQVLSTMSVMYANDEYIGLRIMPALDTGRRSGTFYKYGKRDRLAFPDDSMAVRSKANELSETRTQGSYALVGRALKEFVDQTVINNQDAPLNEIMDAQAGVLEGLAFLQEKRIATAATTGANFAGNTVALAAVDRWDSATGGDPIGVINAAIAAMWMGRGPGKKIAATSLTVWNILKVHPRMLDMIRGNRDGMLTREMFAAWFEIDELLIGKARQDTANEGAASGTFTRIWPDSFGIYRVAPPSVRNAAFGFTFREKPPVQRMWFTDDSGEEGGWYTQASHADQQNVVAGDTAYLVTTPTG